MNPLASVLIVCMVFNPLYSQSSMSSSGTLSMDVVKAVMAKYVDEWNRIPTRPPLWVMTANPGDSLPIPGVTFGNAGEPHAGMHLLVSGNLIVLNPKMIPESLLQTFLHEYGHVRYKASHPDAFNDVDSEAEAIRFSLEALEKEGFISLAYREASADKEMGVAEPYKSAIEKLAKDPLWLRYALIAEPK